MLPGTEITLGTMGKVGRLKLRDKLSTNAIARATDLTRNTVQSDAGSRRHNSQVPMGGLTTVGTMAENPLEAGQQPPHHP